MIPAWNSFSPSFSPDTRRVFLCVLDRRQSTKSLRWLRKSRINKCHYLYNEKTCWAWCLAPNHHHASPLLERQTPLWASRRGFSLINCLVAIWWKACAESPGGRGGNERQGSSWRDERHRQRIINMSALNLDFFFFLETDLIALMRVVKLATQCFSVGFRCDSCTSRWPAGSSTAGLQRMKHSTADLLQDWTRSPATQPSKTTVDWKTENLENPKVSRRLVICFCVWISSPKVLQRSSEPEQENKLARTPAAEPVEFNSRAG